LRTSSAPGFDPDTLGDILEHGEQIELRHDIDFDPTCALEMAKFETACRVRATFYFMVRGPYNSFSPDNTEIIRRIRSLGHEIGLHVELGLPREAETPVWLLRRACTSELRLAVAGHADCVGGKVSFHAPPRSVYWRTVPGFEHALSPRWEGRYLADSRGVWKEDPLAYISEKLERGERPQILLHPEWWFWPSERADRQREIEAGKP